MEPQQWEDCINYMCFGAAESLLVKWQRPKRLEDHKLSMAMKNMVQRGAAADIDHTYRDTDTVTGLNVSSVACK